MRLVANLLSRSSRSNAHVALLSSSLGALRAARGDRDVILRAQIEMWRVQNRRKRVRTSSRHRFLRHWRFLGHREATRGASRRCARAPGEPQGGLQEPQSHDRPSLWSDYELPRSYDGHRPSVDRAATELRWGCDGPSTGVIFSFDVFP